MMSKILTLAALFFAIAFVPSAIANQEANECSRTANLMFKSCTVGAESDFQLALAKCTNIPGDASCTSQANADRTDNLQSCRDEREVRQTACEKFGQAAYNPTIDPANFVSVIDNPYFPLTPGTTYIYEGQTADGLEHNEVTVTHRTRTIMGVKCVEVKDTVRVDGKLTEDTLDWFAQDVDGNVWYFGENTHELENGLISTIEGSFRAGIEGAKPGIIMEAHPKVGDFYRQEFDLGNAEDNAQVTGLNASVTVPAGHYNHCLKTTETTPLEPDAKEDKYYAKGVGNVLTVDRQTGQQSKLIKVVSE